MKFVSSLSDEEINQLKEVQLYHSSPRTRLRASVLLLSHARIPLLKIAEAFFLTRQTVSTYIDEWENTRNPEMKDLPRCGAPTILNSKEEDLLVKLAKKEPKNQKKVLHTLEEKTGKTISSTTFKTILKKKNWTWRRIRKSLKSKRNEEEFRAMEETIGIFEEREDKGELDLFHFDGAGFTLEPSIPYAWQEKGETIEVPSEKSKRINVLGFLSRKNEFHPYVFESNIDSEVVISCMDNFCEKIKGDTIVLLDRAPVHTSKKVEEKWEEWCEKGLIVLLLPAYSPELNKIEILWRKIKYEWLPFSAYQSYIHLKKSLMEILRNIGGEFRINSPETKS